LLGGIGIQALVSPKNSQPDQIRTFLACAIPGGNEGHSQGPHNLSAAQSIALIDRHLKDNPEDWNKPIVFVVFAVLGKACRDSR
jgi:hypothetical protein